MFHRLSNGKKINIHRDQLPSVDGLTDGEEYIKISTRVRRGTRYEMEILIHELLHAEQAYAQECHVMRTAESLSRMLWRIGYRRPWRKAGDETCTSMTAQLKRIAAEIRAQK